MKTKILIIACFSIATTSFAQGVQFETGNWTSVLAKANKEHKLIYMDVYTTWCGPCKILEKQVFPQKAAGDKYNKLFVNYRVDAEKGEGIVLAKKYEVNGYPTNLYIDPANGAVVYRTSGTSGDVDPFIEEADNAILEQKDPMTWDKYTAQYKAGKKDKKFLKAYLTKAHILNKSNDNILNDYVAVLNKQPVTDSDVYFVADQMVTTDNNAIDFMTAHKERLETRYPDSKTYFKSMVSQWSYGTFEKAVTTKNESLLNVIAKKNELALGKDDETMSDWYRTQYFTKIGDEKGALTAGIAEANFLSAKPDTYFAEEDTKGLEEAKRSIRQQLVMMKVPAEKLDELVKTNVEKNATAQHSTSAQTADKLNSISWNIYEHHAKDNNLVKQALGWSKRSLDLSSGMEEWPSFADTYAHLLYVSGNKEEAIKTQQEAVDKSKAMNSEGVASLEETLKQMKEGKL